MGSSVSPATNPLIKTAQPGTEKDSRYQMTVLIGAITSVLMGIASIYLVTLTVMNPTRQIIFLAGLQVASWLISIFALLRKFRKSSLRTYLLIASMLVMLAGYSTLIMGQAITSALLALAYTILITSVPVPGNSAERGLWLGGFGAWVICLAGMLIPYEKIPLPGIHIFIPMIFGIFGIFYIALLVQKRVTVTLRLRMIMGSVLLVILPLLMITLVQASIVQNSVSNQIKETLLSAADQTAFRIDQFLESNRDSIALYASLPSLSKYLSQEPKYRPGSPEENNLWVTFETLKKGPQQFLVSFGLLDYLGLVVYDINPEEIGQYEAATGYFSNALRGKQYISNIEFSEKDGKPYLYFASPIYDENRVVRGIIRSKYDATILQSTLSENASIVGPDTYPVLIDENLMRLGDTKSPQHQYMLLAPPSETTIMVLKSIRRIPQDPNFKTATELDELSSTLTNHPEQTFLTTNFDPGPDSTDDQEFVGVARINNKPWSVLYTRPASALSDLASAQQRSTTLITAFLAGLAGIITTLFARALTQPISKLTETAQIISRGDLTVNAAVSNDEIGALANAFNVMTNRLRMLINELEDRVNLRTSELAERNEALTIRSRQIQTISEVARTIAASQTVIPLLNQVVDLVSSRFNFYHAGIFLIDDNHEYAELRASNSQGGKRMLARQHKLRIGQVGIVGHVCGSGKARIATDVGNDAVFFSNPDLPNTRSEMALPLVGSGQVIGALDVQSTQSNAFTQEDIELFSTLADQIAIAILNSQAFEETQRALAEAQLVHRQYLEREWNQETAEKDHFAIQYTSQGLITRDHIKTVEIDRVFSTGEMFVRNSCQHNPEQKPAILGIPIKLRGATIGIIHLQDENPVPRDWADEEIQVVQSVADQVAQALENARLFQQTLRKAERERKVMEISSKIRSTTDPELMMQIAVQELQQALRVSKTQVIINQIIDQPETEKDPTHGSDHTMGSNGNGKSPLA